MEKVKKPVFLAAILATIFIGVMTCTLYKNYSLQVDLEAWEIATEFISMLFPLIVVIPSCWTIYYERKNKFLLYTLPMGIKEKVLTIEVDSCCIKFGDYYVCINVYWSINCIIYKARNSAVYRNL